MGIKQHTRAFQPIPDELRSRVSKPSVSLAMWELKRRKQENEEEPPAFEWFDGKVRPGRFFTHYLVEKQVNLLREGYAPAVGMNNLFEKSSLFLRLGNNESFHLKYMPENYALLKVLGDEMQVPYKGGGEASFMYHTLLKLLRRKRGTTRLTADDCYSVSYTHLTLPTKRIV